MAAGVPTISAELAGHIAGAAPFCGWCLTAPAETKLYTVPTCASCAAASPRERALRWVRSIYPGVRS